VVPSQLQQAAEHAKQLGFIPSSDLSGLVDTSLLKKVMGEQGAQGAPK
jgi:NitT/TauT family transport system substrate-binding protein